MKPFFQNFATLKVTLKSIFNLFFLAFSSLLWSQHSSICTVELNPDKKTLTVQQEVIYFNQSNDTLKKIVFNDWNYWAEIEF